MFRPGDRVLLRGGLHHTGTVVVSHRFRSVIDGDLPIFGTRRFVRWNFRLRRL